MLIPGFTLPTSPNVSVSYGSKSVVSVTSVVFLVATFCAYVALREEKPSKIDAAAEYFFLAGLVLVTLAGFLLAVEII